MMVGWKRILITVGEKIGKTHMSFGHGASAELIAAATIGLADLRPARFHHPFAVQWRGRHDGGERRRPAVVDHPQYDPRLGPHVAGGNPDVGFAILPAASGDVARIPIVMGQFTGHDDRGLALFQGAPISAQASFIACVMRTTASSISASVMISGGENAIRSPTKRVINPCFRAYFSTVGPT